MPRQVQLNTEETGWWQKLKRRKVISTTILYAVPVGFVLSNTPDLFSYFQISPQLGRLIIFAAVASVPVVALLAWLYEVTPKGIRRDSQDVVEDLTMTETVVRNTGYLVQWEGKVKEFMEDITLGRDSSCSVQLTDPQVSRKHAEIKFDGGRWILVDLGSRNGTRLDGKLIDSQELPQQASVQLHIDGPPLLIRLINRH